MERRGLLKQGCHTLQLVKLPLLPLPTFSTSFPSLLILDFPDSSPWVRGLLGAHQCLGLSPLSPPPIALFVLIVSCCPVSLCPL